MQHLVHPFPTRKTQGFWREGGFLFLKYILQYTWMKLQIHESIYILKGADSFLSLLAELAVPILVDRYICNLYIHFHFALLRLLVSLFLHLVIIDST